MTRQEIKAMGGETVKRIRREKRKRQIEQAVLKVFITIMVVAFLGMIGGIAISEYLLMQCGY